MSRNDILTELYTSTFIDDILSKIASDHPLKADLKQELFIVLAEMPPKKLKKAKENNYLNYLCINILKKMYHSSTSPFHKKYRKFKANDYGDLPEIIEEEKIDEEMVSKIMMIVDTKLELIDRELFKMYYKWGRYDRHLGDLRDKTCNKATSSFRKIEKKLTLQTIDGDKCITIDHSTVHLSHQRSIEKIRQWLEKIN